MKALKLLYTGVWASGYMKRKDAFLRVSIKGISLVVHTDNTFRLSAKEVMTENDESVDSFTLTGNAQLLYEDTGDVSEVILSELTYQGRPAENATVFSISRRKCTRLPIPDGEAFFCFSSRLPHVSFESKRRELLFSDTDADMESMADMSFEDLFEDFPSNHCSW
jgi:hypothetical protein